jgi:hypothetical protein
MGKNRHRLKMVGTIFIAVLCGTLALLWPQWRDELGAQYGNYGYGPPEPPPGQSKKLPDFPGSKILSSGPNPVHMMKTESSTYVYEIILNANFDNTKGVFDAVPSLFTVTDVQGTCGATTFFADDRLRVTDIVWDLVDCENDSSQSLTVTVVTSQKPGSPKKPPTYEPKACGPFYLNAGAYLIDPVTLNAESKLSNSLFVAACLNESDMIGCVDEDNDGWTYDCGDCDDSDSTINPDAPEVCGDGVDNNCNAQIDEGC